MLNIFIKKNFYPRRFVSTIELTRNAIANKPLEWHDLIQWLVDGQKTLLWRDEQCAEQYIRHQKLVAKDYKSINDFIRINYLKWDTDFDRSIQKSIAVPSSTSIREPLVTPNSFPYYLVNGIQHWLIWCDPKPKIPEEIIQQLINKNFPSDKFDTLSFVNPLRLRSVSDVFHAHVFTREKKI